MFNRVRIPDLFGLKGQLHSCKHAKLGMAQKIRKAIPRAPFSNDAFSKLAAGGIWAITCYTDMYAFLRSFPIAYHVRRTTYSDRPFRVCGAVSK